MGEGEKAGVCFWMGSRTRALVPCPTHRRTVATPTITVVAPAVVEMSCDATVAVVAEHVVNIASESAADGRFGDDMVKDDIVKDDVVEDTVEDCPHSNLTTSGIVEPALAIEAENAQRKTQITQSRF